MLYNKEHFACSPHIPVFILANSRRAELRRVWLAREKQILFTLAQHVLSVARVIAKILLMDFANDERVPWATMFRDVTLGRVQLHRLFEPDHLQILVVKGKFEFCKVQHQCCKWAAGESKSERKWKLFFSFFACRNRVILHLHPTHRRVCTTKCHINLESLTKNGIKVVNSKEEWDCCQVGVEQQQQQLHLMTNFFSLFYDSTMHTKLGEEGKRERGMVSVAQRELSGNKFENDFILSRGKEKL